MAGHSHWARIKRKKGANDAKRGRLWSKLARKIIVAAREAGGDPAENLQLRYAIEDAKDANMPNDNIDRAIKKGVGDIGGASYEAVVYEGYGPGGVAFMVECLTDNRNRTAPEMRKIFERSDGQLGQSNCVAWMFSRKGSFVVSSEQGDEDTLMELALEHGAEDVTPEGDLFEITCDPSVYQDLKHALAEAGIETVSAEVALVPLNTVTVEGTQARKVLQLMEELEDHDDVQSVYANFNVPDNVMAEAEQAEA
ncbi:MAG: YebC/PmpR family DNA-binding transcriptional regulator [Phycisphaerae bacterium]